MQRFLQRIRQFGVPMGTGVNLIAFSGGVDSSVVAAGLQKVFAANSRCIIGVSGSLPKSQLLLARKVANHVGLPLQEVLTNEGNDNEYIRNEGRSCYVCKQNLYQALTAVCSEAAITHQQLLTDNISSSSPTLMLFNGTNKDDLQDSSRVGLVAAREYRVCSPLDEFTKVEVRQLASEFGLPNHNTAASPCLRSRLAFGVPATIDHLRIVESAEEKVKLILQLQDNHNMRVRILRPGNARVELDESVLEESASRLQELAETLGVLGLSTVNFQRFRSGSVAVANS